MTEKEKGLQELLTDFEVVSIDNVNHKPHAYMIGPKHVVYASDNCGGGLFKDCIERAEKDNKVHCYQKNCTLTYSEHTYDTVAFLKLRRNLTSKEAQEELSKTVEYGKDNGIDGFLFVENEYDFIEDNL